MDFDWLAPAEGAIAHAFERGPRRPARSVTGDWGWNEALVPSDAHCRSCAVTVQARERARTAPLSGDGAAVRGGGSVKFRRPRAAWRAGSDGVAHAHVGPGIRTLCGLEAIGERYTYPATARCATCVSRLERMEVATTGR